jgi:glutathione peroxidase
MTARTKTPYPAAPPGFTELWSAPIRTLAGKPTQLSSFEARALLLVNVASHCGSTPQYAALEALHQQYGPRGLTVIGFPSNQFGKQEPGSPEEIAEFCTRNYGVTFPLMEKIDVNGDRRHPIYARLAEVPDAGGYRGDIRWNFEKFVIAADCSWATRFINKIPPNAAEMIAAVEAALPATA